ncbi:MAG: 50S ribosomal protein L3 [Simkaniaceae bacterium]|nr:50S ribosomal protein L3 [Simkaniaceae bacterium]
MTQRLYGKKRGMTKIFDENGHAVVCTVLEVEPNVVVQVKTDEKDGYQAVQLGAFKLSESQVRRAKKPVVGHYKKGQVEPRKKLFEAKVASTDEYQVGQEISLDTFSECPFVDVIGISKGKGFQGEMKRHNFKGGPAAHGSSFHRTHGSTGMNSYPGRTFKGMRMAGHMGDAQVVVESLKVVRIDTEKNMLLVKGSVPGPRGANVCIRKAMKK